MKIDEKYELVLKAYQNAYAKYSKFKVGALVILKNGDFLLGSNIENASYGLSNCAERSALFATYSNGFQKDDIEELVLIGRSNNFYTHVVLVVK
ncbi:MAG: cytidine deaminase family protein [Bacilli bacterium]